MAKVKCECGFTDEYEPDEFGINYYQAVGLCPDCGKDLGTKTEGRIRVIPNMQSFDLLLCSGNGTASKIITKRQKRAGYSEIEASITHLALSVVINGRKWVWESTTGNWKWAHKTGVQFNLFDEWQYNGKVWLRHIEAKRTPEIEQIGLNKMLSLTGRRYESGLSGLRELIHVMRPATIDNGRTLDIHCTEGGGEVLQEIGWLKKTTIKYKGDPGVSDGWTEEVKLHKLPPAMFWKRIDSLMNVKVGQPVLIKG